MTTTTDLPPSPRNSTTSSVMPKSALKSSSPLVSSPLPPLVPIPTRQPSPSLFKQPSLPSSRSYPSLLSLSSSPSPSFRPLTSSSPSSSPSTSHLRRVNSDLCRLGHLAFSRSEYDEAICHYTAALELSMDDPRTWNNRATCYVAKRMYRMGIRDYHEAIQRAPRCGEFYYKRGVAWSALKQYAYAIEDYSKCLELKAEHADALNNRGNAYRILNQFALARADLVKAVALVPASALYAHNLRRVEAALAEEEKTGKSAQQAAIESILQSVLQARLQGNHAQPILPGMNAHVEHLLKQLIHSRQSRAAVAPLSPASSSSPPLSTASSPPSAFSPPVSRTSSPAPSPSSPSSSSLSDVIDALPAQLLNTLLQLFLEHRSANRQESQRTLRKRHRTAEEADDDDDAQPSRVRLGEAKVYGDELYDDDHSVEAEDDAASPASPSGSEGSRSPESGVGGGGSDGVDRLDIGERCRNAIAV